MKLLKKKMQRRDFLSHIAKAGLTVAFANQFMFTRNAFAAAGGAKRFVFVFYPNGCVRDKWHSYPTGALNSASLTNTPLEPLAPYADKLVAFKNLSYNGHGGSSGHPEACRGVFSGGRENQPSFDVALGENLGGTLTNNLHVGLWSSQTQGAAYMPFTDKNNNKIYPNDNPQSVFDNTLADLVDTSSGESDESILRKRVLESLHDNLDLLQANTLNVRQTAKLNSHEQALDYYQSVLNGNINLGDGTGYVRPAIGMTGINSEAESVCKAQFDNIAMAFQADITRTASFQFMAAQDEQLKINFPSIRPYMGDFGTGDKLQYNETRSHVSSHNESDLFDSQTRWYNLMVAYFIDQLSMRDDLAYGGKLIDNTLILMASEVGGGNHQQENPGVYVIGGAGGAINGGTAIDCGGAGMSNLYWDISKAFGLNWQNYGNSFAGINGFLV